MKEKTGNTVKLVYDFPTQLCCEIEYNPGKWIRTTPRDFRSFGGNRRILNIDDSKFPSYEDYKGPVYYTLTNHQVTEDLLENTIMSLGDKDPRNFGLARLHETK